MGSGGHANAIAELICPTGGLLIGVDRDPAQVQSAQHRLRHWKSCVMLVHNSYDRVAEILAAAGRWSVDGVLLDVGVAQQHIDDSERGMSYRFPGAPLDLRFDPTQDTPTAADMLANSSASEIGRWFREYGELSAAKRLARAIVERRQSGKIETIGQLEMIVTANVPRRRSHNPMTLVLQALRIAVNDELAILERALSAWVDALNPGGHLVVISYHSLEDRIVKQTFRRLSRACTCPPEAPLCICRGVAHIRVLTPRAITPTVEEQKQYPTSRSARLRAAQHL